MSSEDMLAAVCIAIWIVAAYIIYRIMHKEPEEDEISLYDSKQLQDEVHALNEKMNRLAELDNMIIDLRLCKPAEVMRNFRMEWEGSGRNHALDFMADGQSASSEHLMQLAIEERAQINEEITERIFDLYARACKMQSPFE